MILLPTAACLLSVITGGAQAVDVHVTYTDLNGAAVTPGDLNTAIASATTTNILTGAGAGQRTAQYVNLRNNDAAAADAVTVTHFDGTTTVKLVSLSLPAGWQLSYNEDTGWTLTDANGATQQVNA